MANEETYLQNLLANRKIVRNYIETNKEFPELKKVIDYAIKIPTAAVSYTHLTLPTILLV